MGSKKHKKHKSERREKYEEYSNNTDPAQMQRGLKLILKVGDSPLSTSVGPPTAAEAMMSAAPSSPMMPDQDDIDVEYRERHKKSKKKKKKKDREKKHKHHKEKRHRHENREYEKNRDLPSSELPNEQDETLLPENPNVMSVETSQQRSPRSISASVPGIDGDSSHDGFSFMDDENSQPLPENILLYAGMTTDNSPSCRPVSKPIVAMKLDDLPLASPTSSIQSSSLGAGGISIDSQSPTKPLTELLIPSPSTSTAASTPGGGSSTAALTPKALEQPKTPSSSSESGREPRTCVLKLKHQKSPLNKLLDHLLRFLEKRDPHQFFAWPVTDDIAPGYSSIITKPMDFSTMHQKIDDCEYASLGEFSDDFKLMCENAIRYNHVETVYHKAAKRLLQVGIKHLAPENLVRSLKPLSGYLRDLTVKELGFELSQTDLNNYEQLGMVDSADEGCSTGAEEQTPAQLEEEERRRAIRLENKPKSRFEPYIDDLTSDEILAQVQNAARAAKKRLSHKEKAHKMGFLRQQKDGTTSLSLLIKDENEGPEKVISIGDLVGKMKSGSGQLYGLREDKRNDAKLVKPLNYGAFASYAPVFDSRFASLSKDECQLVLATYGDATSTEYAESILQFTKDSSYASMLANGLLDILTNGEHSKAMNDLYELQVRNYEEHEVQKCFLNTTHIPYNNGASNESREQIEGDYEKYKNTRIDFNRLRTLKDIGVDIDFLDNVESEMKNFELTRRLQEHLSNNLNLIEKLRTTQHERLSQPMPQHLAHVQQVGQEELHMAHQITQQLTDIVKKLPPSAVTDPYSIRKAMGMSYVGLPPPPQPSNRIPLPDLLQQTVAMPQLHLAHRTNQTNVINLGDDHTNSNNTSSTSAMAMDVDGIVGSDDSVAVSGVDLEHELRQFLESGSSGLHTPGNSDDNIVAELLMN